MLTHTKLLLLLLPGLIWSTTAEETQERHPTTYWFLFPKTIRPGIDLPVHGEILNASAPVTVDFVLIKVENDTEEFRFPSHVFQPNVPEIVNLAVPMTLPDPNWQGYDLNLVGSGGLSFNKTQRLSFNAKSFSIVAQTDKAKYKPGDTVKFRVVVFWPDLKIVKVPLKIVILDPDNNQIKEYKDVQSPDGVFEDSLGTSTEPVLGQWTIKIKAFEIEEEVSFSIEEYVLPKFETTLDLPPVGLTSDTEFVGHVKSKYTFGQPVDGTATVTLRIENSYWYYRQIASQDLVQQIQIVQGIGEFRFPMDEIRQLQINNSYDTSRNISEAQLDDRRFTVIANVTEAVTGKTTGTSSDIKFYDNPHEVEFEGQPSVVKPGLSFRTMLKITKKDNTPLPPTIPILLDVTLTLSLQIKHVQFPRTLTLQAGEKDLQVFDEELRNPYIWSNYYTLNLTINRDDLTPQGHYPLSFDIPRDVDRINIHAKGLDKSASLYASRAHSPSSNYIQISLPQGAAKPKVGEKATIIVRGTEKIKLLHLQVLSKGQIVKSAAIEIATSTRNSTLSFDVISAMAPMARVLVYYLRADGEVVADSTSVSFEGLFDNPVTLTFDKTTVKPGEDVQLRVKTGEPGSLVKLLSVDKSVKLLASGNDITEDVVLDRLNSFEYPYGCYNCDYRQSSYGWWSPPSRATDAAGVFADVEVLLITDGYLYRQTYSPNRVQMLPSMSYDMEMSVGLAGVPAPRSGSATAAAPEKLQDRVRTKFPETWLFDTVVTDEQGNGVLNLIAPDTITTWTTSGFAVHDVKGLSVATQPAEVTTFLPLFVQPHLPYSVIRGEIVCIQTLAFNYNNSTLPLRIALEQSNDFFNIQDPNNLQGSPPDSPEIVHDLGTVKSGGIASTDFCINPRRLGSIALNITLTSTVPGDAVSKSLLVEPEGVPRSENTALLFDLRNQIRGLYDDTVVFITPTNTVEDTFRVVVSVVGDILGPTLNNLGSLVQLPTGCAEQNIAKFAPNVYIYKYLNSTGRLDSETEAKIKDFTAKGYQRQLRYKRNDGSYGSWGDDSSGSVGLTAFVVKSFAQASTIVPIETKVIDGALQWLLRRQHVNGSFTERGQSFSHRLEGASKQGEVLTAYVLIAISEALAIDGLNNFLSWHHVASSIERARRYLEIQLSKLTNPYDLAIVMYALRLSQSPLAEEARLKLETKAIFGAGTKHYQFDEHQENQPYPWYNPTDALAIQANAYALCDAATQNDTTQGFGLLRWLTSHMNPYGGFVSTQDTVIALQCLEQYAELVYADTFDMDLTVDWEGESHTFSINKDNSLTLQTQEIKGTALPGTQQLIKIQGRGSGLAVVDVTRRYNMLEETVDPAFDLDVFVQDELANYFLLNLCTAYKLPGSSDMAVLEIGIPSGFDPTLEDAHLPYVTRKDVEIRKIILYFDEIRQENICLSVPFTRSGKVANGQSNVVKVYDFYQPRSETTKLYALANKPLCVICPECDLCITAPSEKPPARNTGEEVVLAPANNEVQADNTNAEEKSDAEPVAATAPETEVEIQDNEEEEVAENANSTTTDIKESEEETSPAATESSPSVDNNNDENQTDENDDDKDDDDDKRSVTKKE